MNANRFPFNSSGGQTLAIVLDQFRFVIEQIELRRSADHVQVNHVPSPRRKVGWPSGKRICEALHEVVEPTRSPPAAC